MSNLVRKEIKINRIDHKVYFCLYQHILVHREMTIPVSGDKELGKIHIFIRFHSLTSHGIRPCLDVIQRIKKLF